VEIQSNAIVSNTAWGGGFAIYNNGQPANQSSQGVLKATAAIQLTFRSLLVRASSTTEGYRLFFDDGSGTTYTKLVLYKNGTWCNTFQDGGSWSCLADITLRLDVVTVGSDAVLTAWLNGVQIGSAYTDTSSPITTGLPGFQVGADGTPGVTALDDWCDLQPWDIGADEYVTTFVPRIMRPRFLIDASGDPAAIQFQLEYRYKPSGGAYGDWAKVDVE
jgi:hypothetical protein